MSDIFDEETKKNNARELTHLLEFLDEMQAQVGGLVRLRHQFRMRFSFNGDASQPKFLDSFGVQTDQTIGDIAGQTVKLKEELERRIAEVESWNPKTYE